MMMPSAAELHYFVEVASTLNISRAAERLGISQPTLSLSVQKLEASFGVPLLIRSKSGVKLTKAGVKFVAQARHLLNEWEKLREHAVRDDLQITGRYTLGCHPSVAIYSTPHFLPALLHDYPELEIKLVHDLSRRITEEVISFRVDFGLVVNPVQHPDLVIKLLCLDEVGLWTSRDPSTLQDVKSGEGVLICDPDLIQTQSLLKDFEKAGLRFKRTITTSNLEVVTALVVQGAGVGILPNRVATHFKTLGLKPFRKDSPHFQDKVCLVYRADTQKSKASRLIGQTIEKALKRGWL